MDCQLVFNRAMITSCLHGLPGRQVILHSEGFGLSPGASGLDPKSLESSPRECAKHGDDALVSEQFDEFPQQKKRQAILQQLS